MDQHRRVLVQFDTSSRASLFDTIAALDVGIDTVLPVAGVSSQEAPALVQDALFCRAPGLSTAFWIGGRNHQTTQAVFDAVGASMVPPFAGSVARDPSGANTTAAAVCTLLKEHVDPRRGLVYIIGGSGMVGQSVVVMASKEGYQVVMTSPHVERLRQVREDLVRRYQISPPEIQSVSSSPPKEVAAVIAVGPPGVEVFHPEKLSSPTAVLVDVNAVPPAGIAGVQSTDHGRDVFGAKAWGALAVGARKMKIHHRLLRSLFGPAAQAFDCLEILELAKSLDRERP